MNKIIPYISQWLSKSGDTTMWSWVITFTYLMVIIVSLYYTKSIKDQKEKHLFWVCISLFVFAMGINKQLDLQILISMIGKTVAWNLQILEYSRAIWKILAVGIFFIALITGVVILYRTRKILPSEKLSLSGVAILLFFTLIRVGSISHLRIAMYLEYGVISRIHGLELLGLLIILLSLILKLRKHHSKKN